MNKPLDQKGVIKKRLLLNDVPLLRIFPCLKKISKKEYFSDKRVLIVEDTESILWALNTAIEDKCLLALAQDAERALILYKLFLPDMIILDLGLPGKDGLTLLEAIKKFDPYAYVVIFSGKGDKEAISKARDLGAIDFIPKPFSPEAKEKIIKHLDKCTGRALD